MRIAITIEIYDANADPDHEMGVTTEAYEGIVSSLDWLGDDIQLYKDMTI